MKKVIKTAAQANKIKLRPDRVHIKADGTDCSFIIVEIVDKNDIIVPDADNLIEFMVEGEGKIIGVDNGNPVSHEPFKEEYRKAYNGKCLIVVQSTLESGIIEITAKSEGLEETRCIIQTK